MDDRNLLAINALAELDRLEVKYEVAGGDEVKIKCPFHDDDTPSCSVNTKKNLFRCYAAGCNAQGDLVTLLTKLLKTTRSVMWVDLAKRYNFEEAKSIDPSVVERWHEAIWTATPLLSELYARGVTEAMIRKRRLGFDGARVTIPVYNAHGTIVNVRRYLPGAPASEKMRNIRGHGAVRLYPIDQLKFDNIVICGGEIKAVVTASHINQYGYGAITATAGEGNWEVEFNNEFKGKVVWVMLDIDSAGRIAAEKLCARLKADVQWVGDVRLPLDIDKYPHGDINDWFGHEDGTGEKLVEMLEATDEWVLARKFEVTDNGDPVSVPLSDSSKAEHAGRRVTVCGTVSALDTAPYVIPKVIKASCPRNQECCSVCPVFVTQPDENGIVTLNIHPESPAILEMIAASQAVQREAIIRGLRMPSCDVVDLTPVEFFNVEDARLTPQLEIQSRGLDDVMQAAYCIGHGLEANESYVMTGRMYPHPKTQQAVLLLSESKLTDDALSSYKPSSDTLEALGVFAPGEWTTDGITRKLSELYDDLSANVTHVYDRQDLHLAVDLAYHSVLLFEFDGAVTKGWSEVLVVGDSSQGKSETAMRLMKHYGVGERVECKNATVAGLLGGLQQIGSRWFVTWGVIPTHDKRLVILEEVKGASTEVIGKLTDMRSSGVAEIPKIEKRRAHARTRLLMISNPRGDRPLSMYNFGIEAVRELIGGLEDVRRFDCVLLVSSSQIDPKRLNQLLQFRPEVEHRHTAALCRDLVLWSWTRKPEQVMFEGESRSAILVEATRLCERYVEAVPIVDRGSMRFKIARLAIALACRTFSTTDAETVVVKPCHVKFISEFLDRVYASTTFGYLDFSNALNASNTLVDPHIILKKMLAVPFPSDFANELLHTVEIELRDICDWCGWTRDEALDMMSLLVRKHALLRDGRSYRKSPKFIEFLKDNMRGGKFAVGDRPSHVAEEF